MIIECSNNNSNNSNEAKKFALKHRIQSVNTLIIERLKSLSIISAIAFTLVGISISINPAIFKNVNFAYISFVLLILIALISLGKYLCDTRSEINALIQDIKQLETEDWNRPVERKEQGDKILDPLPEIFFGFLVFAIILFIISLIDICKYLC